MFGDYELANNQTRTLIEHWNGTSWSIATSANRAGAAENDLIGAACPSTTSCFAGGFSATAGVGRVAKTLVERWDGKSWSVMTSPNPTRSQQTVISGVSCRGTTNCFAVGNEGSNAGGTPGSTLIEHWDGKSWSIMTSPNPGGAPGSTLDAISCPGTTTCFAIGDYNDTSSPKTLLEQYA
jgi:hypothetical protein